MGMKSLTEYIKENFIVEEEDKTQSITFNFDGIDNAEETVKSLSDMEYVSVDGNKVTVTVTPDNCDKLDVVQDILQQSIQLERAGTKSTNDEQYSQKVSALEKQLAKFNDALDEFCDCDCEDEDCKKCKKDDEKNK